MPIIIASTHGHSHAARLVQEAWRRRKKERQLLEIRGELYKHELGESHLHEKSCCPCLCFHTLRWGHEPSEVAQRQADGGHAPNDLPFGESLDASGAERCPESTTRCRRVMAVWCDVNYGVHKLLSDSDSYTGQVVTGGILIFIIASCIGFVFETLPYFRAAASPIALPSLRDHSEWEEGAAALARSASIAGLGAFLSGLEVISGIPFRAQFLNTTFAAHNLTEVEQLRYLDAEDLYEIGMKGVLARAVFLDGMRAAPWGAASGSVAAEWNGRLASPAMSVRYAEQRSAALAAAQRWRYVEPAPHSLFGLMEIFFIIVFTSEYIGRLLTAIYTPWERDGVDRAVAVMHYRSTCNKKECGPSKWPLLWTMRDASVKLANFIFQPMNVVDLLAIAPFYLGLVGPSLTLGLTAAGLSSGWAGIDLRILRVLRVLKLVRYSKEVRRLLGVLRRSASELALLVLLMGLLALVFGALVYFVENAEHVDSTTGRLQCWHAVKGEFVESPFRNILQATYWVIVSISQVGWGDVYPVSSEGHAIGTFAVIVGVIVIALPVGVIGSNWASEFEDSGSGKSVHVIRIGNFAVPLTKQGRLQLAEKKIEQSIDPGKQEQWAMMIKQSKVRRRLSVELGALQTQFAADGAWTNHTAKKVEDLRVRFGKVPELSEMMQYHGIESGDAGVSGGMKRARAIRRANSSVKRDGSRDVKLRGNQMHYVSMT